MILAVLGVLGFASIVVGALAVAMMLIDPRNYRRWDFISDVWLGVGCGLCSIVSAVFGDTWRAIALAAAGGWFLWRAWRNRPRRRRRGSRVTARVKNLGHRLVVVAAAGT
jgi:hypothetical protein